MGEGNLISGNGLGEIGAKLGSGNFIIGNYIGTDISGRNKLGNPLYFTLSLEAASSNNRIENNVIAGNINFGDPGTSYNEVVGNLIGTDATGTVAFEGDGSIGVSQPFNRIGGTKPGEGNIINGTIGIGRASDVLVMGNLIGTTATGKEVFDTTGWIINLGEGSHHNFIGGATEAERNIINGGRGSTLVHLGGASDYNFIAGNHIGTDSGGAMALPNFSGISLETAENNYIQGNLISGSTAGISLAFFDFAQSGANFNLLRGNLITQNSKVGIGVNGGKGNKIFGNSLINNTLNGYDGGGNNRWDDGRRGNYWDNYAGKDKNGDGIGDTPYPVSPNAVDNYPMTKSYNQ
jgi:hypothetical protein